MSKNRCKGCGAILQNEDANQVGYTPDLEKDYCQDCFRLAHYGEVKSHFHPDQLPTLKAHSLALMVSSVMALDMLFFYPLHRYAPKVKYTYIINQIDLLPTSTNYDALLKNIIQRAKAMHIPYQDIILMSAKHQSDVLNLKQYIESFKETDIYLLGVQNAGKTTLYKALVGDDKALAMNKAGLTQETLMQPLNERQTLYDMPGLFQEGYLHQLFTYDQYKKLLVSKPIKPVIYQMKPHQALLIEGLVGIVVHDPCTLVSYTNQQVSFHRTNDQRLNDLLNNQTLPKRMYARAYETRSFHIPQGKHQLTFADFGFVHLKGPMKVDVTYPKHLHVSLTEALFS